uniref:Reverse transcriptase Ty1/copia-type domain-containing protein n=1 Tax=Solanum lycopersicum TaxID=4081 RepID=A0A3Q7GJE0_SOLLC
MVDFIDYNQKDSQEVFPNQKRLKDHGRLKYFLGIEVAQSRSCIVISQRKYALDILEETREAVVRILRYIKSTLGKGLLYEDDPLIDEVIWCRGRVRNKVWLLNVVQNKNIEQWSQQLNGEFGEDENGSNGLEMDFEGAPSFDSEFESLAEGASGSLRISLKRGMLAQNTFQTDIPSSDRARDILWHNLASATLARTSCIWSTSCRAPDSNKF